MVNRAVCTWSFEPWFVRSAWDKTEVMLAIMAASIDGINKNLGIKPVLYTDSLTADLVQDLGLNAELCVKLDGLYDRTGVNKRYWMYPKLETYLDQTEPYIHFDLDMIMHKPWPGWFWQADVGFQCFEFFFSCDNFVYLDSINEQLVLPEIFYKYHLNKVKYPNVGFLYVKNMEFNKLYAETAIKMVKDNPNGHDFLQSGQIMDCVVEQQLLGLLLRDQTVNYRPFLPDNFNLENMFFDHYVGGAKNSSSVERRAQRYLTDKVVKWAEKLDKMRENK